MHGISALVEAVHGGMPTLVAREGLVSYTRCGPRLLQVLTNTRGYAR
jgi:hypothetical protein